MRDLFAQIRAAVHGGAYYLSLFPALTLPDICGAMESPDGQAKQARYVAWFDKYVGPKYQLGGKPSFTGKDCYYYRCSLFHQGTALHPKSSYSRIIFVEPNERLLVHNGRMNDVFVIDVGVFCEDVVSGAEAWLTSVESTNTYQKNFPNFLQRYTSGFGPISGVPTIA